MKNKNKQNVNDHKTNKQNRKINTTNTERKNNKIKTKREQVHVQEQEQ